jgi:hypothetical protein
MTLFHIENKLTSDRHRYVQYHRLGGLTFCIDVTFYPEGIEYSQADISVLSEGREWTELAEFTADNWHAGAKAVEGDERIAVFKQICAFLLEVGCQATGLMAATAAEDEE